MIVKQLSSFTWLILASWLLYFFYFDLWHLFSNNYFIPITMAAGSFIAGATSEGGGAVAFPVLTLVYKIIPSVARDYSLLIQSFGMSAATFTILKKKITIDKKSILYSSFGAVLGNVLGFLYVVDFFNPAGLKLFFCSLWLAFAFTLLKVKVFKLISHKSNQVTSHYYIILLIGILGGILSSLMGSGLDILVFSVLTLFYRMEQKIAVPTSVIIMAVNSIVCVLLKTIFFDGLSSQAILYAQVSIPVVVIGAPLGSLFINKRTDLFITLFLVLSICVQFIAALFIISLNQKLITLVITTFVISFMSFYLFSHFGDSKASDI